MILTNNIIKITTLILFLFLLVLLPHSPLIAEDSDPAFKSVTFGINHLTNTTHNALHHYWEPLVGGEAEIGIPFYAGNMRAGLHLYQFNGRIYRER